MQTHSHITLSQLQRLVKETLHERFALPVWVSAEISEIKSITQPLLPRTGRKRGRQRVPLAQSRAVIWRTGYPASQDTSKPKPASGSPPESRFCQSRRQLPRTLRIFAPDHRHRPHLHAGRHGTAAADNHRPASARGVWDMNREAPMPVVVQRVAVVSSANAAGYQTSARSWPKVPTVST